MLLHFEAGRGTSPVGNAVQTRVRFRIFGKCKCLWWGIRGDFGEVACAVSWGAAEVWVMSGTIWGNSPGTEEWSRADGWKFDVAGH